MEMNELKSEELEAVVGGQSFDPDGANWQYANVSMGTTFIGTHGGNTHTWYRIKRGDTLSGIAAKFGTTPGQIQKWNPKTIKDINKIGAGDTLIVRLDPTAAEQSNCTSYKF